MNALKRRLFPILFSAVTAAAVLSGAFSLTAGAAVIDDSDAVAETVAATDADDLPSYYSSVNLGYVTPIRAQRFLDCWAHSTIGTLETTLLKNGYDVGEMSVDHLNLWATTRTNGKGWIRSYSSDSLCTTGPGYLAAWQGGVLKSDVPDLVLSNSLHGDEVASDLARYGVTSIRYLSGADRETIKRAIYQNGGVASAYGQTSAFMNNGVSYYYPPSSSTSYSGHAIEVVGWDDNYDKSNFNRKPKQNGAWLVRNSWGDNNSLGGYFWMSYEDKYIFNASKYFPSYAIESFEVLDGSQKLIQNEIYGATYEFDYLETTDFTVMNRFDFDGGFFMLDKVVFETRAAGADYALYYVPEADGKPNDDESAWTPLGSGVTDYAGYFCADIQNFELPQGKGSIALRLHANGGNATVGVDEWLVKSSDNTPLFTGESEYGMSYIYQDGKSTDLMQWYKDVNGDEIGGTFVMKAVTVKPEVGDVNLDGAVNILDATLIQQYKVELVSLSDNQKKLADANGDGEIDISDATAVQMMIATK